LLYVAVPQRVVQGVSGAAVERLYSDPYGLCPNPTAMGLGSLQCATEDFVEAARRFPAAVLRGAWEAAKNPFVQQIALNAIPVARGVRAAAPLRAAAQRAANAAQALKPRPGMAAALEVGGEFSTATSGRQVLNPTVQGWVDEGIAAGKQGFGGACAETNCISNAMNAGVNPSGGRISTAAVGRAGSARHGAATPPCANCEHVLGRAGVTYVP
jgi:hypothetical protein